ncbi:MAG: class I SAM-dependent methyltransferase [Solobacterium sp.]|nr:class I SAM-dependent methyltransferase [Solobacterium sp.]MBR0213662.1 class I SAM-dependent methyltransferase [Solobacterium sp.]MBR0397848.1 class I SAM-dependent methyltransferase [Eubacterium sp.]
MDSELSRQILDIIRVKDTENFDDVIAGMNDWQMSYHLGSLRKAFLHGFVFNGKRALEVGPGFGALTGMLLDHFDSVDVLEPSPVCIEGLKTRYRHRQNLNVIAEPEKGQKYDLILAIDCLDRTGTDRGKTLRELKGLLAEDGTLICNFHNRLGIRYLCGCQDSFVPQPFLLYRPGALLSRSETVQLLKDALDDDFCMYYPVPDSSWCQMLFSDDDMPSGSIRDRLLSYDPFGNTQVVYEPDLYDDLLKEGVFGTFANEFLIQYQAGEEQSPQVTSAVISADREQPRAYGISFLSDGTVRKSALYQEGTASLAAMQENMETLRDRGIPVIREALIQNDVIMPRYHLPTLQNCLLSIAEEGKEQLEKVFDRMYEMILRSSETIRNEGCGPILQTGYIDMIPLNIFFDGHEFLYFDQEFTMPECPAAYIIFRAVLYAWLLIPDLEKHYPREEMEKRFHLTGYLQNYQEMENAFVGVNRQWQKFKQYYNWQNQPQRAEENRRRLRGKQKHD